MNGRLFSEFYAVYNKVGATSQESLFRKPLRCKAFRASFILVAAGYIGAGNAEGGGHFPLGQRQGAAQTVPQADDLRLPG